ncbi:hypothetical protein NMG60_11003808 [Bertholletia excelsa]
MDNTISKLPSTIFTVLFFSLLLAGKSHSLSHTLSSKNLSLGREKLSHLRFYFHDIVSGKNATAVRVAESTVTAQSPFAFGSVMVMDDPLTATPDLDSPQVGRAQGIYASAAKEELGFLIMVNFVFTSGKYNGSSLSMVGRNAALTALREMPVVGGSGLFRFAHGYAEARTHWVNLTSGDAVVEYNLNVLHY